VSYDYNKLIDGAVGKVKRLLDKGVVVLIPPGSSRGKIVGSLQGVRVVAYRELAEELAKYRTDVVVIGAVGGRLLVGGKSLAGYIKGEGKLSESLRGLVIVPRSTIDALLIRQRLYEELVKELGDKRAAEELVKKRVKFYFPPKYYGKQLRSFVENLEEDLRRAVEVDYSDVLKDIVEDARGISLKLLNALKMRGIEYVKAGVMAIRELDPGVVGLSDVLKGAGKEILRTLSASSFVALVSAFGGAVVAPVILTVLRASSLGDVKEVLKDFLNKLNKFAQDLGIESLNDLGVSVAERIFELFTKRGKPRDEMLASIARLIKAAVVAKRYLDDDTFETVVDEVAAKWGLTYDAFRHFIDNLYKLATEKLVTEEELERLRTLSDEEFRKKIEELVDERWEKLKREIEGRLDRIEEELEKLRNEIRVLSVSPDASIHFDEVPGVVVGRDVVRLSNVLLRGPREYVDYVPTPLEEAIAKTISEAALRGGGLVLVVGGKGIGKSTAAKVALAKILRGVVLVCNDEKCNSYKAYRPVVVALKLNHISVDNLKNFVYEALKRDYLPLFYLDPSKTEQYIVKEGVQYMPEKFGLYLSEAILSLMGATDAVSLVVLSKDQYKLVENLLERKEVYKVDADEVLKDAKFDFVKGVVEKYSECGDEVSSQLARSIVNGFDDNYAVVAVLAADWLAKRRCDMREVVNAIEQSRKKVKDFVLSYMWFGLLGGDQERRSQNAAKLAPLILATGLLGPFPRKLSGVLLKAFNVHGDEDDPAVLWLTQDLHGTILETLRELAVEAVECVEGGCDYRSNDPRHIITQMRKAIIIHGLGKTSGDVVENLVSKLAEYSVNDSIFKAEFVEAVKRCPWEFAEIVGIAYTPYSAKLFMNNVKRCGLAEWLTVDGEMPWSARELLIKIADKFADIVNPCDIVTRVHDEATKKEGIRPERAFTLLGALAISKDGLQNCLKDAAALLPLALYIPVIPDKLREKFGKFVENLIENSLVKEAIRLIDLVNKQSPLLAYELLKIVEKAEREGINISSDWVTRLLYEDVRLSVYSSALASTAYEIHDWAQRVAHLVLRKCSDVSCLYTQIFLGIRLAELLHSLGKEIQILDVRNRKLLKIKAKNIIDGVIKAIEELERQENLAKELEPLLKAFYPFKKPEEVIRRHLAELKRDVYNKASIIYLSFDLGEALKYAEEGRKVVESEKLGDAALNKLLSDEARIMFLMGQEKEAIEVFRKCMTNMLDKFFIEYSDYDISAISAQYIASFLAEGKVDEALSEYRRHKGNVELRPEHYLSPQPNPHLLLVGLMRIYGLNVEDKDVEYKRRIYMVTKGSKIQIGVAAALAYLYGLMERKCEYGGLTAEDRAKCEALLEVIEKPNILRMWLVEQGLVEEALVEGVEDPLEMLEIVASSSDSASSLIEIMYLISRGRVEAARRLAEYVQKVFSVLGMVVPARLFGELASSLGEGKCGDNCKKALLKLFYLHV